MHNKNLVPTLIGFAVTLGGIYLLFRFASTGWKAGQK